MAFLDLMEDYFNQPLDDLRKDERPELGYRMGLALGGATWSSDQPCFLNMMSRSSTLDIGTQSPYPCYRFQWNMGEKAPYEALFSALKSSNVVPSADFLRGRWAGIMDQLGQSMKNAYVMKS